MIVTRLWSYESFKLRYTFGSTSNNHNSFNLSPNYAKFVQIESQDVYFPMKQISLKNSLWIKSYSQISEKMLFFSIIFKAIWAFLSYDYFQTIKIILITFFSHVKLIIGTKD